MKTICWRRILRLLAETAAGVAVSTSLASAQEKPDAPQPQPNVVARQDEGVTEPQDQPKKSALELFLGFHRNFAPFEVPDNAKPLTVRQKYAYAFHEAEDLKAHVGNVLQAAVQQGLDAQPHYGQGW